MNRSAFVVALSVVGGLTVPVVVAQNLELVIVAGGHFTMGLTSSQRESLQMAGWPEDTFIDEMPAHEIFLPDFWIMREKVSNAQFVAYLNGLGEAPTPGAGGRYSRNGVSDPAIEIDETGQIYAVEEGRGAYPVSQATWGGARGFCANHGMRLPTEAEWEKAARGEGERMYPWGDTIDRTRANYGSEMTLNLILFRQTSPDDRFMAYGPGA